MQNLPILHVESQIRKPGVKGCPFGLSISASCRGAGRTVERMVALDEVEKGQIPKQRKANRKIMVFHQDGERCMYADKIVDSKDIVNCDYGDFGEGVPEFPIRPSPFFPRVTNGLGYGLFGYGLSHYMDTSGSGGLFSGIYGVYASTGKIEYNKDWKADFEVVTPSNKLIIKAE